MTTAEQSNALLATQEAMSHIAEAASGYKLLLERHGFSPTAAELMATQYHQGLINKIFEAKT